METLEVRELDAALRLRFDLFLMRCFLTVNPGATFVDNWHIDGMVHQVERIRDGEVRRLIVNIPPRSLKSLAFNVAFMLGHDPRKRIFCISYGAELRPSIRPSSRLSSNRIGTSEYSRACRLSASSMTKSTRRSGVSAVGPQCWAP